MERPKPNRNELEMTLEEQIELVKIDKWTDISMRRKYKPRPIYRTEDGWIMCPPTPHKKRVLNIETTKTNTKCKKLFY